MQRPCSFLCQTKGGKRRSCGGRGAGGGDHRRNILIKRGRNGVCVNKNPGVVKKVGSIPVRETLRKPRRSKKGLYHEVSLDR